MALVRKTRSELRGASANIPPERRAWLDSLTDDDRERLAAEDPDNPPLTDEQLERAAAGRIARLARERAGMTQAAFAEAYKINLGRLRDLEQGRKRPDPVLVQYLKVILAEPEAVNRALFDGGAARRKAVDG